MCQCCCVNMDIFLGGLVIAVLAPPRTNLTKFHANLCWTHTATIYLINSWDIQTAHTGSKKNVWRGCHRTKHVIRATSKTMHFFIQSVTDNVSCFQHRYIFGGCHAQLRNKFLGEPFWVDDQTHTHRDCRHLCPGLASCRVVKHLHLELMQGYSQS